MPLEQHPTDPDKVVYVRNQYDILQLQGVTTTQRPWVDLTDEEIGKLIIGTSSADTNPVQTRPRDIKFARSVLAKFKEKNNGTTP
jgi:hypothetical protein